MAALVAEDLAIIPTAIICDSQNSSYRPRVVARGRLRPVSITHYVRKHIRQKEDGPGFHRSDADERSKFMTVGMMLFVVLDIKEKSRRFLRLVTVVPCWISSWPELILPFWSAPRRRRLHPQLDPFNTFGFIEEALVVISTGVSLCCVSGLSLRSRATV